MAGRKRDRGAAPLAEAVNTLYSAGQTDYWLEPIVVVNEQDRPVGRIKDGDAVVFCCRRGEREIQLTDAFVAGEWDHFPRRAFKDLTFVILTLYHEKFAHVPVAFAPTRLAATLGEAVAHAGLRQARIAESEKYAHVTFFLNGGSNVRFAGEDDVRIPSPSGIPFDQAPELSLAGVAERVVQAIGQGYDLIVTNFANGDVIGHLQSCEPKLACARHVDKHLGDVVQAARSAGYTIMVTADHGNLEEMLHPDGTPHVAHTANLVPFIVIAPHMAEAPEVRPGALADIAPTVLQALGIAQPAEMTGASLAPALTPGAPPRVLLIILDGWGIGKDDKTNPIFLAETPVWDDLTRRYPYTHLRAAGEAVGLQEDKPGNSEAGHMNIGAGRVVVQDDVRLDRAMQDGSFYDNEVLRRTISDAKQRKASLHLLALLSERSSHGSVDYPLAALRMAKAQGLRDVFVHIIFDGRSTPPGSAPAMLAAFEKAMNTIGAGQIASGVGRGFALDRDGNYDRTRRVYDALVFGAGVQARGVAGG